MKKLLSLLLASMAAIWLSGPIFADEPDPNIGGFPPYGGGNPKKTPTHNSPIICHHDGNMVWFTFASYISGFTATIVNPDTNEVVVEYITDNTPVYLASDFTTLEIECVTDDGRYYTTTIRN